MSYPPDAAGPPPFRPPEGQHPASYPPPSYPPQSYPPPNPASPYGQPPYPPPGYQQSGYPQHPPTQSTSGFAIASLVFGVIGGILLSAIFGIVALGKTKPGGQRGRGLAIAGLALSGVWTVIIVIGVVAAVLSPTQTESALDVKRGQCLADVPTGNRISSVNTTGCDHPHSAEVIAVLNMPNGSYPNEFVFSDYKHQCGQALNAYSSTAASDPSIDLAVMPPSEQSWAHGDRAMVCIATFTPKRTGSIKN